ncbi:efflux RND transporter periplasmic adaptor subunit [Marimonas sp. MJW-29]|uniref:Efflux RND transporter periplasmic adaptor subunit n=1 Tax=Sulfitobacter sediminis TaxID=3234186 RepID=A0ABV3RTY6_9RHOB
MFNVKRLTMMGAAMILMGTVAVVSSRFLPATDAMAAIRPVTRIPTSVSVAPLHAADHYSVLRRFSGRIEPNRTVDIAFDEPGRLAALLADEGQSVVAGTALAKLDTELLQTERFRLVRLLATANEERRILQTSLEREESLSKKDRTAMSTIDHLRISLAQVSGRTADLEGQITMLEARIRRATLFSPFSGSISQHFADFGSSFEAGQPILRLIEDGPRNVRIGIDAKLCRDLSIGDEHDLLIGAELVAARITAILPDLDPATQTRTVLFELQEDPVIIAGSVATVQMTQEIAARGAQVPISALRDGSRGLWEIMVAQPDGDAHRIAVEAVEILNVNDETAFVRGTFDRDALLVTEGQHRLVPGQTVSPIR